MNVFSLTNLIVWYYNGQNSTKESFVWQLVDLASIALKLKMVGHPDDYQLVDSHHANGKGTMEADPVQSHGTRSSMPSLVGFYGVPTFRITNTGYRFPS